jgi:site-specific DNA recombinase
VWGVLRNPAYKGEACFGKTTMAPRQRITRPIRMRGGVATRNSASHERAREDWITIAVPPIVSEETFALAQERLQANKIHAPRRTVTPSVVQGLASCTKCGYALYRTSTRSSARKIHYYRCLGSDTYRHLAGPVCNNRPVRQDLLDDVVWTEIVQLLEDPRLIQNELERRLMAAREADPTKRRDEALQRDLVRIRKGIERLLTAYQEGLLPIEELRERMPELRRREQASNAELQAIADRSVTRAAYLRLAETLNTFLTRLRSSAGALDVSERQRIMRLLVKEVLVGDDKIIIRHCIPLPNRSGDGPPDGGINTAPPGTEGYLLRSRSHHPTLRRPCRTLDDAAVLPNDRPRPPLRGQSRRQPASALEHPVLRGRAALHRGQAGVNQEGRGRARRSSFDFAPHSLDRRPYRPLQRNCWRGIRHHARGNPQARRLAPNRVAAC